MEEEERLLLLLLGECYNRYISLPVYHPMDQGEFCNKIHDLQRHVMSRESMRKNPSVYFKLEQSNSNEP